jgi:hypothetical protein
LAALDANVTATFFRPHVHAGPAFFAYIPCIFIRTPHILSPASKGTNSTFSGNGADLGGGIQNAFVAMATVTLSNTILANSKGNNPLNCRGQITDGGYNISDDSSCAFTDSTSKNSTNPLLDLNGLQNHGGPTQTIALQKGSPALDYIPKGQNDCNTTIKTDQRGVKRPQGKACDVGAYELK